MAILVESTVNEFDTSAIERGYLISVQHSCWDEPKNGIVSAVTADTVKVLIQPPIANVTSYLTIYADEVADGEWTIRLSEDLTEIVEYPEAEADEDEDTTEDSSDES